MDYKKGYCNGGPLDGKHVYMDGNYLQAVYPPDINYCPSQGAKPTNDMVKNCEYVKKIHCNEEGTIRWYEWHLI